MKVSEVIKKLEELKEEYGELEVGLVYRLLIFNISSIYVVKDVDESKKPFILLASK